MKRTKPIVKPRAMVLWGEGPNTDHEMKYAFELAGARADKHMTIR